MTTDPPDDAGPPARRPRTLIIEDDRVGRTVLAKILEEMGHDVSTADTLGSGLAKLAEGPETVLLDLMLPDGSGVAILERVRRDGLPVRVAVTSGTGDPEILRAATDLHPDAVFRKPLYLPDIARWLTARR